MRILKPREWHREHEYERRYLYKDDPSAGFGFPCDADGVVDTDKLAPIASINFRACVVGAIDVIDAGVETVERVWANPAVGLCACGAEVLLEDFTNTCDNCGRDYNRSGQEIPPPAHNGAKKPESIGQTLSTEGN